MAVHFANLSVDESVLQELHQTWEQKTHSSKVADFPIPINTQYQQSVLEDFDHAFSTFNGNAASLASMANKKYPGNINQTDGAFEIDPCVINTNDENGIESDHDFVQRGVNTNEIDLDLSKKLKKSSQFKKYKSTICQRDGGDDEDDEDEDEEQVDEEVAIDSELDDEEEEEDVETEHIILCQYEKVHRVKNKWKVILRDGIVNVNGKDYLFNKATGEFQW